MKNLLIKLGLWEEEPPTNYLGLVPNTLINDTGIYVEKKWYEQALRHFCNPCNRWFGDTRGKLMHDRHRHKE